VRLRSAAGINDMGRLLAALKTFLDKRPQEMVLLLGYCGRIRKMCRCAPAPRAGEAQLGFSLVKH